MANFNEQVLGDIDLSSDVLHRLSELCMSSKHSDVTFVVENTKIPAHKMILASCSSYFEKLFAGGFAEETQSEIKLQVPLGAFKMILRFIYTGYMRLDEINMSQIIDIYGLVELYDLEPLKETISKYLAAKLSLDNCVDVLNATSLYSLDNLNQACLTFMDGRSTELIKHDTFNSISSTLLCTLLKRDTFYAPEIDIFVAVKDWINLNPDSDSKTPLSMVRWSLMSTDEIMDIVLPSNVLDQSDLMDIIKKNRENKAYRIPCNDYFCFINTNFDNETEIRILLSQNLGSTVEFSRENFASAKYNAETIFGENAQALLDGNFADYDLKKGFTYHSVSESYKYNSIIVKLGKIHMMNYIEMLLMDKDKRSYSYYIDVSVDGDQYERLIDFTACYSRSWQFLHFPSRPVQFIKIVGTQAINIPAGETKSLTRTDGRTYTIAVPTFDVVDFKAIYINGQDTANLTVPGFLRPTKNVARPEIGAIVLKGGGNPGMLNENMDEFTCHQKDSHILLQLNQPYYIGSLRMLLGCDKNHTNQYSFYIETSLDNKKWQMAVDKRDECLSAWQQFEFEERPVVFVKIVGTKADTNFVCTYFECPSNSRKPNLRQSQSAFPTSTAATTK